MSTFQAIFRTYTYIRNACLYFILAPLSLLQLIGVRALGSSLEAAHLRGYLCLGDFFFVNHHCEGRHF